MAVFSPCAAAAHGIRSAIVCEPVADTVVDAVAVASIRTLLLSNSRALRRLAGRPAHVRARKRTLRGAAPLRATASDRIGDVEEDVAHAEAIGDVLAERPHPEGLGGVVPGADEVDAGLAGGGHHALGRLAGEQRICAGGARIGEVVRAGARDDRQAADARGPGIEDERVARGEVAYAREQLFRGGAVAGEGGDEADRLAAVQGERLERGRAERLADNALLPSSGWASSGRW